MKHFIDTHDKTKGTFPAEELTEEQFWAQLDALGAAGYDLGVFAHAINLRQGRTFCVDSITQVRRVTGADLRPSRVR
jgi:hypothetical protein